MKKMTSAVVAALLLLNSAPSRAAEEPTEALSLARQLNEAFVSVSDRVSKSVVVIQIAYKRPSREPVSIEDFERENPWLERLPDSIRKYLLPDGLDEDESTPSPTEESEPFYSGNGSGVIVTEDGFIVTNHHVVEGADQIKVRLKDGREFPAVIQGTDEYSEVAVIKITESVDELPVATFADSDKVRVGEYAIAIGTPFALDYSVTVGHVSALGRAGVVPNSMGGHRMDQDFIQTDANINPGNSGGPLVNLDGDVMGINTLIRGIGTGIGFAVPSNLVNEVAEKLIETGKFERAWLGIGIRNLRDFPNSDRFAPGRDSGMVVLEIPKGAPAEGSGLKPSDVIVAVNGVQVTDINELRAQVRSQPLGSTLTLDVVRMSEELKIEVKTGHLTEPQLAGGTGLQRVVPSKPKLIPLGISVREIDAEIAREYDLGDERGVFVSDVEPNSAAARGGILPGTVITDINHQSVSSLKDYQELIEKADLSDGVLINFVDTNGNSRFEVIKE